MPLSERSLDPSSSVVVVPVDPVSVVSVVVVSVVAGVDVVVSVAEVAWASVGVLVMIGDTVPEPDDLAPPRGLLAAVGVAVGVVVLEAIGIAARASAAASSCASGRQSVAA